MARKSTNRKIRRQGEGSIYPRTRADGTPYWAVLWSYLDQQGKPRRGYAAFATEDEAVKHARRITLAVDDKSYVPPSELTVEKYLRQWMAGIVFRDLAPQTQRGYRRHVEQMIPRIGHLRLTELTGPDLDVMYAELLETGSHAVCCKRRSCGSHRGSTGLSKKSVRHYHATLCSALRVAVKAHLVPHAVTQDANPPSPSAAAAETESWRTWSTDEVRAFLTFVKDTPLYPIWHFLLTTGCRRGEALGLRWSDVDFDTNTVTIQQTVGVTEDEHGKRQVIVQNRVKGGVGHTIYIDPGTMAVLRARRTAYKTDRLRFGESWQDHGLVFHRGMGTKSDGRNSKRPGAPLDGEWVSSRWRELILAAHATDEDIKVIRLHDTRHTWATLALKNGVDAKVVQEQLNHKHVSITQGLYQHVDPGMGREAAEKIAGLFS